MDDGSQGQKHGNRDGQADSSVAGHLQDSGDVAAIVMEGSQDETKANDRKDQ